MKLIFDEPSASIEIEDDQKLHGFMIKFILVLNVFNGALNLYMLSDQHLAWMGFTWILIGGFSLCLLIYLLLKKSFASKIELSQIKGLREKSRIGRKGLSLQLKSGKSRDMMIKERNEINESKKFFQDLGIEVS